MSAPLDAGRDGAFSVDVSRTDHELPARGRGRRVAGAARPGRAGVRLAQPTAVEPTVLSGTVRPRLPGAIVHVERLKGSTLGSRRRALDGAGAFRIELAQVVPAGTDRARTSPAAGLRGRRLAALGGVLDAAARCCPRPARGRLRSRFPGSRPRAASRSGSSWPSRSQFARRSRAVRARVREPAPIPALVVEVPAESRSRGSRRPLRRAARTRRLAFTPTDPFVPQQWYLTQSDFYESWTTPPPFAPVRVAIIDSGIDGGHPELAGADPRREELRRRLGPRSTRTGTAPSSPG